MRQFSLPLSGAGGAQVLDVMAAASMLERMRGLLGRPPLRAAQAMLLCPCNMVHTVGMRYPIDVVFLARDGRVLKVAPALAPRRAASCWRAHAVLELAAGTAARCHIVPGTMLALEQPAAFSKDCHEQV